MLGEGLRGGVRVGLPLVHAGEPRKGLGSVTFKINNQHAPPFWRTLEESCKGLGSESVSFKV